MNEFLGFIADFLYQKLSSTILKCLKHSQMVQHFALFALLASIFHEVCTAARRRRIHAEILLLCYSSSRVHDGDNDEVMILMMLGSGLGY